MINSIEGKIKYLSDKFLVVETSGLGYKVFVLPEVVSSFSLGQKINLWTYLAVRENSMDLYGFEKMEELNFFELLLDVSGIGPKSALSILGVASIEVLKKAIGTGDTSYLTKVSGIGRKTADKIVVELKDKLKSFAEKDGDYSLREEGDVVEALKSLGYSQSESREILKKIPSSVEGSNARIKEALKLLSSRN